MLELTQVQSWIPIDLEMVNVSQLRPGEFLNAS